MLKNQTSGIQEPTGRNGNQSRQAIDLVLNAIADAIVDRLEHRQESRRRLLDLDQTVEYLGISESGVYNLISDGKIRPVPLDRRTRLDIRDLDKLIDDAKGVS